MIFRHECRPHTPTFVGFDDPNMEKGHVFVIDDYDSIRNSIGDLLSFAGYSVRTWREPENFLNELPQAAPAVVVTDMRMPDITGLELHKALLERGRSMPVVYISGESSVHQSIEAMKLGAMDFLIKPFTREELLKAVASGIEKDRHQMRQMIEQARFEASLTHLTPREREVYRLLRIGFSNNEIVDELGISLPTAKQYKSMVMRKLGVRSLSQLLQLSAHLQASAQEAT